MRWAGPRGHHPDDRREVRSASFFSAVLPPGALAAPGAGVAQLCAPPTYQRHRPEDTVLYRTLDRHLETFLARASDQGGGDGLPAFVTRELRAYLRCGRLEHGCVHVRCEQCGDDMVVAFSCKGRGFCPSCGGRRMSELAAQLVDRAIPQVPVRQWVLSVPSRSAISSPSTPR
jgi:hypothetical protein